MRGPRVVLAAVHNCVQDEIGARLDFHYYNTARLLLSHTARCLLRLRTGLDPNKEAVSRRQGCERRCPPCRRVCRHS